MTVTRQWPLAARFAGEDGNAPPGVGQSRPEQQWSRYAPTLFQPPPILQFRRLCLHFLSESGAVVGTDPASVDADMATTELPFVVRGDKTALTADL